MFQLLWVWGVFWEISVAVERESQFLKNLILQKQDSFKTIKRSGIRKSNPFCLIQLKIFTFVVGRLNSG